ncbi:hypothetical protein CBS101457_000811 [Exobasidium rhododendri]|nr:hypothetical protein CBS101457_000811 [Exobasidium rhododendri]
MRFNLLTFAVSAALLTISFASKNVGDTEAIDSIDGLVGSSHLHTIPVRGSKKHFILARRSRKDYVTSSASDGSKLLHNDTEITWYASQDLKNPACNGGSNDGWAPTNDNHIGAIMAGWDMGTHLKCGKFVDLCNESIKVCVKVRIVDKCAACKPGHVDLSKKAFLLLAPTHSLDEGVVKGLKLYANEEPSIWDFDLFGPKTLVA